jgi:hypothetical protein
MGTDPNLGLTSFSVLFKLDQDGSVREMQLSGACGSEERRYGASQKRLGRTPIVMRLRS